MTIRIPWFYIAIFVALCLFYYVNQKTKIRRDARRDRLREAREEYLNSLLRGKKEKEENQEEKDKLSND